MPVISDGRRIYLTGYSSIHALDPVTPKQAKQAERERRQRKRGKRLEPDRDPGLREVLLRFADPVSPVVKDRGAEDRVGAALADRRGEVLEAAGAS